MRNFLSLLLIALILAGCSSVSEPKVGGESESVRKIGVISPLTGGSGSYGEVQKAILDYAYANLSEDGQSRVKLVFEDGKCNGIDAVNAYQKLVDLDKVDFVLGGLCSDETFAIEPLIEQMGVPMISALSSSPALEGKSRYLFSLSYNDVVTNDSLLQGLSGYEKVVMLTENVEFTQASREYLLNNWPENVELLLDEQFPMDNADFRNLIQKTVSLNPDAVVLLPNVGVTAESLAKQLQEVADLSFAVLGHLPVLSPILEYLPANTFAYGPPAFVGEKWKMLEPELVEAGVDINMIGSYYTVAVMDAFKILIEVLVEQGLRGSEAVDYMRTNSFQGALAERFFGENNFVQGVEGAAYKLEDGAFVMQ